MSNDTIISIITAVKQHECLWNVQNDEYAKRDKLEKAWKDVARTVGKSKNFCRDKWRNVRTGFLRSIHFFRNLPDEVNNNVHVLRRKRFYLHDQMEFLLPSAEALVRKKRKNAKGAPSFNSFTDHDDSNDTIMQDYSMNCKYENTESNQQCNGKRELIDETTKCYDAMLGQLGDADVSPSNEITLPVSKQTNNTSVGITTNEIQSSITASHGCESARDCNLNEMANCVKSSTLSADYYVRDDAQLLDFFRGNLGDIMSLPKRKQRLFKRKMLDLIEELHAPEEDN